MFRSRKMTDEEIRMTIHKVMRGNKGIWPYDGYSYWETQVAVAESKGEDNLACSCGRKFLACAPLLCCVDECPFRGRER